MTPARKTAIQYAALLVAAFITAILLSWFAGAQVDNYAYDFMFRLHKPKPWQPECALLAIDEKTLRNCGGISGVRKPLAEGLHILGSLPKAVVVDLLLADPYPSLDPALADAFRRTPNLVLSAQLLDDGWEDPREEFAKAATAIGHIHSEPDSDYVTRSLPLEKRFGRTRRWAISLEAFRLSHGGESIVEYPEGLLAGGEFIPAPVNRRGGLASDGRLLRIRYVPPGMPQLPRVSLASLIENPAQVTALTGKVVFIGVTAISAGDRLSTPISFGTQTSGVEIHAHAYETMAQEQFLRDAPKPVLLSLLFSALLAAGIGLSFRYLPGWRAYAASALLLAASAAAPYILFAQNRVFSFVTPVSSAWLTFVAAAGFYHLVVRRSWKTEEAARTRYQQAMHFVTHEMRTPLSAIQGSSELISKYALPEEKRQQVALLINSESKRLARMVEIFLNVERLSAGHMELKRETISVAQMVETCVERVRPLAERKRIAVAVPDIASDLTIAGDRELMEYACYNLLTNAVKYSPQHTEVTVSAFASDGRIRIAVKDQGIGMDEKEVRQIFRKFYRTKKAEQSGEAGTGIGLSIVEQIVEQHGGMIEVASRPGAGSCFTLALPAAERN